MSLNIRIKEDDTNKKASQNIEDLFSSINLTRKPEEIRVIELIEKGKYNDSVSFIDRFGIRLPITELSTGCKTALCIINNPTIEIDTQECGINAVDVIVSTLKNGNIIIKDRGVTFVDYDGDEIDVQLDGYRFTSIERLNYYYFDERPYKPDFGRKGVEKAYVQK